MPWSLVVDLVRESLFVLSHLLGGSTGAAVIALSVGVRLALLPLGLRLARRVREQQRRLQAIQPQLNRLRERYGADRRELARRVQSLLERERITMIPKGMALTIGIQLPIGAALYQAITTGLVPGSSFLWIADLASPDAILAAITAALAAVPALLAPATPGAQPATNQAMTAAMAGLVTLFIVWRVAAGVGIYWAASNVVGIVQSWMLRMDAKEGTA
jgi:YidC/Oxa1 family membrane protein insertase